MDLVEDVSRFSSRLLGHMMKQLDRLILVTWLDDISNGNTNHLFLLQVRLTTAATGLHRRSGSTATSAFSFLYHRSRLVVDEKPFVVFSRKNKTQVLLAII